MSLPPGFLDELRTRLSLADVVGRKVVWDMRKSNQGRGDWWAPCPFHQEKSASFHVVDTKGFYNCFGCGAKGDMFKFVQESENVTFMEAVEILAGEAGLPMPARDPRAKEKTDRATELAEVMDLATRWFRLQLQTGAAAEARAYLARRGLDAATIERFEIGFAPNARDGLQAALKGKGVSPELIEAAGLARTPDDGRPPYDTFRDRIQFPIRDPRGRCVAFGGRAMAADARAKYLNSPETELFKKSYTLYNHGPARAAAGQGQPLIVAEGYMDVIALSQAGFGATVAALGTAVTPEHLKMLWRFEDEPIFAMDGDAAGVRAAFKVIDIALPILEAGKSVRFALMPEGRDPDDVLRAEGAPAMQALLDAAVPMVQLLWRRETEGKQIDSPERRAKLDKELRTVLRSIQDPSIRGHYGDEIARLREGLFGPRPARPGTQGGFSGGFNGGQNGRPKPGWSPNGPRGAGRWAPPAAPVASTKSSALAQGSSFETTEILLEGVVLTALAAHPSLIDSHAEALEQMIWTGPGHEALADALLRMAPEGDAEAHFQATGTTRTLETLHASRHVKLSPALRPDAEAEDAAPCIIDALTKLEARRGHRQELSEAIEDLRAKAETHPADDDPDEKLTWRLNEANQTRARADRAVLPETGIDAEDRASMSDYLQNLLDTKVWEKKKR
jgi:DNA primase